MVILYFMVTASLLVAVTTADGCQYKDLSIPNLSFIVHDNDCATLQCQFGTMVPHCGACGRETDGNCHPVGEMFVYNETTYKCIQTLSGDSYEFRNAVVRRNNSCYDEGFRYIHLETFKIRKNRCEDYQCRNGKHFLIKKSCSYKRQGCYLVGEHFVVGGTTYNCTSWDADGVTQYRNQALYWISSPGQQCSFQNKTYNHLQVFALYAQCDFYQCQNATVKKLTQTCAGPWFMGVCYEIGKRATHQGVPYECVIDKDTGETRMEIVIDRFLNCTFDSNLYKHLDKFLSNDGCTTFQCQDGVNAPIKEGCLWDEDDNCYSRNVVWESGNSTLLTCVLDDAGVYRVVEFQA